MGKGNENNFGISFLGDYFKIEYVFTFLGWLEEAYLRERSIES